MLLLVYPMFPPHVPPKWPAETDQTIFTVVASKVIEYELSIGDTALDFYFHYHNLQHKVVSVLPWSAHRCLFQQGGHSAKTLQEIYHTVVWASALFPCWLTRPQLSLLDHISFELSSFTLMHAVCREWHTWQSFTACQLNGQHTDVKQKLILYGTRACLAQTHRLHNGRLRKSWACTLQEYSFTAYMHCSSLSPSKTRQTSWFTVSSYAYVCKHYDTVLCWCRHESISPLDLWLFHEHTHIQMHTHIWCSIDCSGMTCVVTWFVL